jgi:hypothetical protein
MTKLDKKAERFQELSDIKEVMKNPSGRRFMWRLLSKCGIWRDGLGRTDQMTYVFVGRRQIGLEQMHALLDASPDLWNQMLEENRTIQEELEDEYRS